MTIMRHLLLIVMLSASLAASAAAPSCKVLVMGLAKQVDVAIQADPTELSTISIKPYALEATKTDPAKVAKEVSEIILMMGQSRESVVSQKKIEVKGTLNLAYPIGHGIYLELVYKAEHSEQKQYLLRHVQMRANKDLDFKANPIHPHDVYRFEDFFNDREISTSDYPTGHKVMAKIPSVIRGDTLTEILELTPKLELLEKDVIRQLARENDIATLQKKANREYMKAFIKRYTIRGIFKTLYKVLIDRPLQIVATVAVLYVGAHYMGVTGDHNNITQLFLPKQNIEWVAKTVQESSTADNMPDVIRSQLSTLKAELDAKAVQFNSDARVDLNNPGIQVSKDQYLWTTVVKNNATGREIAIIFVSNQTRTGQITQANFAAIEVDPVKYAKLISYIRSIGQFIPVTAEDLKP